MKLFELGACESSAWSMSSGDSTNAANYQTFYSLQVPLLNEAFRCPSRISPTNQNPTAIKTQINIHLSSTLCSSVTRLSPKGNFPPHHLPFCPPPIKSPFMVILVRFMFSTLNEHNLLWKQQKEKEKIFLFNRKRHWQRNKRCPGNNGWILLQRVDWNFRFSSR